MNNLAYNVTTSLIVARSKYCQPDCVGYDFLFHKMLLTFHAEKQKDTHSQLHTRARTHNDRVSAVKEIESRIN